MIIQVTLLDGNEVQFELEGKCSGDELLNKVTEHVQLTEKVSFWPCWQNLIKTFQNGSNTSLIPKTALKSFFDQFRLKLLDPQSFHFFSLEKSNLRAQLLSKTFFDTFIFKKIISKMMLPNIDSCRSNNLG